MSMQLDLNYAGRLTQRVANIDGEAHVLTLDGATVVDDVSLSVSVLELPVEVADVMTDARLRACKAHSGIHEVVSVSTATGSVQTKVVLTQAQYDALAVKDPNTEYNIVAA